MSPTSQTATTNSTDDTRTATNEGVSIVSAPKNVKFLIPLGRSGVTSNDSTFSVIESTTRTITHVKDIFPLNPSSQFLTTANNGEDIIISPSNSSAISSVFDTGRRQDENNSEQQSLLLIDNSNQK
jgi:hypothetical protein